METLALAILIIFSLVGFAAIFFTTFGTLIILIGAVLHSIMTRFQIVSIKSLVIILLLYLVGEFFEYFFIIAGSKKFGASNWAIAGALAGALLGAVIGTAFFGIGVFLSTLIGIFLGAFLVELIVKKDIIKSARAAMGGVVGRILCMGAKVIIAFGTFFILFLELR